MSKKTVSKYTKAVGVKASQIKALVKQGYTIGQIAAKYKISRVTLYKRFPEVKGLSSHGSRVSKKLK